MISPRNQAESSFEADGEREVRMAWNCCIVLCLCVICGAPVFPQGKEERLVSQSLSVLADWVPIDGLHGCSHSCTLSSLCHIFFFLSEKAAVWSFISFPIQEK